MIERPRVKTLRQSTAEVESKRAFEFWRDTALAMSGVSSAGGEERRSFTASRLVAVTAHSTLLHTEGPRVDVERSARHVRQDGRDTITIALVLRGTQYFEQGTRGGRMAPGDITVTDSGRPFLIGAYEDYEEIRLSATRAAFRAHVGEPEAYAGRLIGHGPLNALFATYLRSYAALVPGMTEAEADIAVEATLHLFRGLVGAPTGDVTADALRSLAAVHIERSLHDPGFGPDALYRALCVSRSRLYASFADGEGVAAAIRNARLDRAHRNCRRRHRPATASRPSCPGAASPTLRASAPPSVGASEPRRAISRPRKPECGRFSGTGATTNRVAGRICNTSREWTTDSRTTAMGTKP